MINAYVFDSLYPGPRLLVLGAVHGNEICGPGAIKRWCEKFMNGTLQPSRGRVTLIPVCNPEAHEKDVRYVQWNLNRDLRIKDSPKNDEERIGNILCRYLADCDYLLDIHSYTAGGPPFLFCEQQHPEALAFARALGVETVLSGWQNAYAALPDGKERLKYAVGTTEYARQFGAVAVTLECGQHRDPKNIQIADTAIAGALAQLDIVSGPACSTRTRHIVVERVFLKPSEGSFAADWQHLQPVQAHTVLFYDAGRPVSMGQDGVLIMPKPVSQVNEEWLYWGRVVEGHPE